MAATEARRRAIAVAIALSALVRTAHAEPDAAPPAPAPPATSPEPPTPEPPANAPPTPAPAPADTPATEPPPSSSSVDVRGSTEVAGYADTNHVFVVTPSIGATATSPTAGWTASAHYLVDVVSAASVDIVSTASRRWEEVRHAANVDGAYKPNELGFSAGADISDEPDYVSITGKAAVQHDFLEKNLTLLLGYAYRHDTIGRSGTSFDVFSRTLNIHGFKLGSTFVLDRSTILSVIGDLGLESGDSSKPYRYVPMFAPGTAVPKGASVDYVNANRLSARVLEQLPTARTRYSIAARLAHRWTTTTLRLDERLYTDSWGLRTTTTDAQAFFDVGERVELGPHVRLHAQAPVDFWQRAYVIQNGNDFPAIRTGDRELGPLVNVTGGGSLRVLLGSPGDLRSWVVGFDFGVTSTHYLDDLYITSRLAGIGSLSLEVGF